MRLIDADKLEDVLAKHQAHYYGDSDYYEGISQDAVRVVRCMDCKYYEGKNTYCANDRLATPYDYCSRGERRDR